MVLFVSHIDQQLKWIHNTTLSGNEKLTVLPGNSPSFVFLPIHMLISINTGVALCVMAVRTCTVLHKYVTFSSEVDHLQGLKWRNVVPPYQVMGSSC